MKLRKFTIILAVLVFCCVLGSLQAQGMKIFGAVGYGLGLSGNQFASSAEYELDLDSYYYYYYGYDELVSRTDHYFNFGQGIKFGGGLEIPVRPHVTLRVEGNFWKMPEIKAEETAKGSGTFTVYDYYYNYTTDVDASIDMIDTDTYNASLWNVDAVLLLDTQLGDKILYAGAGVGYYNASMTRTGDYSTTFDIRFPDYPQYNEAISSTIEDEVEYTFKKGIGFVGVLGVEMPLNEKTSFFVEVNLHAVGFEIEKFEITKYEEDGVDYLDDFDETEFKFKKDDPDEWAPWTMPGTSATVRAGIKMGLN
ncbi:hypothetical protein HQ585_03255 [candidate division KSB1 bacterium]|nr:hypothetical protein [candidate division KSB1 bacterium]